MDVALISLCDNFGGCCIIDIGVEDFSQSLNTVLIAGLINSVVSNSSRLSTASQRLRDTRQDASKAELIHKQAENRGKRALDFELRKLEMEIKSREFEYRRRLELSRIEVIEAKDTAELAEFEAPMAKQELTELLQDANERIVSPAAVLQVNTKVDKDVKRSLQPLLEEIEQRQYSIKICLRLQVVIFLIDAPTQRYPTQQQTNLLSPFGSTALLNTLVATMEKTGISHDLPAVEIQKFDGSPQSFPIFRRRFYHMIQSKPIDEDVAPFSVLEGPPLEAVKRYEIVTDDIT